MRIRIVGGGWYGCHLALALLRDGHAVELHEIADRLFAGASGANPARLHLGFHYPRSRLTRALSQEHYRAFMGRYGDLTRAVPVNIYAVARDESLVDFGTYTQVLRGEVEFVTIERPADFGLCCVEGAVLTGERHIVVELARAYFAEALAGVVRYRTRADELDDAAWDATIDCTFCALDSRSIGRYEPCLMLLLAGPTDRAVTIMDGPFPSLYPWHDAKGLSSLTSARFTPFSKTCESRAAAQALLDGLSKADIQKQANKMIASMGVFWPVFLEQYKLADYRLSIRAMPESACDARLVDVIRVGTRAWRVRAGKIDAILHAERLVREAIGA